MAGEMRFRNPAGHAGLLTNLMALVNALVAFIEARASLFAYEGKRALVHVLVLIACVVLALGMLAFGYVFLLVSILFAIAHALGVSWVWVGLVVALIHFALAFVFLVTASLRVKAKMFEVTAEELKRDREWLKQLDEQTQSKS
jgi:uncharacterized membrane protein YqjE